MSIYCIPKFKDDQIETSSWNVPTIKHIHMDYEFTTIAEGEGENIVNGVTYESEFGVFMLLGPRHTHQQISDSPIVRRDLCVSVKLMEKICDELKDGLFKEISSQTKPIIIRLMPSECHNILSRLENAGNAIAYDDETRKIVLHSIVSYLLGVYVENAGLNAKVMQKDFIDFMRELYKPEVFSKPISQIIPLSNYSHSRFLVLFKKQTGKTLIEYVTDLRMEYAAKLLIQTNLPIVTIVGEAGYDNQSFFTKKFKEKFSVTPKEFRKNRLIS